MPRLLESIAGLSLRLGRPRQAPRPLLIARDDPLGLTIESRRGTFEVDHRHRTLSRNGRVLARFVDIKSVQVREEATDGLSGHWSIWALLGPMNRVKIGDTDDDVHASTVAARLSASVVSQSRPRQRMLMSGS
ncbi:hypothetical protein [Variovorax sp. OV329]|uniref:hypothetical protein n=1 Tax=Variovorax sp. OV329 TaxID=1882825 RepID=UPI0008E77AD8|nr:hypothetical protein [Variovorax sp. OV329]SFN18210.1 hypothetical protein SAMN05444747_11736 [Variovorax sp. OV329]